MVALVIVVAVLLDYLFAEPKKYHPLVGFGVIASRLECWVNNAKYRSSAQCILGGVSWFLLVAVPTVVITCLVFLAADAIKNAVENMPMQGWLPHFSVYFSIGFSLLVDVFVLYLAIGHASLRQHAAAIITPLMQGDIATARQKVAWIVSRDTEKLDENGVCKATVESVLENGSDAIFAPIFWYMIGGLPAVIIYRLSNTLDAMWGYKTPRFLYFGRFSARMDDVLNYIPSRLVAISYALLGKTRQALHCWKYQAQSLNSPNAGVVMTAGAGALGIALGGEAYYHGERKEKPIFGGGAQAVTNDIHRSLLLVHHTLLLWCVVIVFLSLLAAHNG